MQKSSSVDIQIPPLREDTARLVSRILGELSVDDRRYFDSLPEHDKSVVMEILRQHSQGNSDLYKALWEMDYQHRPPTIDQFLTDPSYAGGELGDSLWDCWQGKLREIFDPSHPVYEVGFTGAIGCLTGDTRIVLLDGTEMTMQEVVEAYNRGEHNMMVPSVEVDTLRCTASKVLGAMFSGTAPTFEATLENGATVRGTWNHPVLVADQRYVKLSDLWPGARVISCYWDTDRRVWDTEEQVVKEVWKTSRKEKVYDLSVSGPHNFTLANGLVVHNTGKTTAALMAQMYVMTRLLCLRDPQKFYGLTPGSPIVIGLFSVSADLVYRELYGKLRSYMKISPFFQEKMLLDEKVRSFDQIRFKGQYSWLTVAMGSDATHALSQNLIAGVLDEMAFKNRTQSATRALDLYFAASRRIQSRFMEGGDNSRAYGSLLCLVSSKQYSTAFIESHLREMESTPGAMVINMAQWEARPRKWSGKKFRVLVGDRYAKSMILKDDEPVPNELGYVIEVPEEYRSEFEAYIDESIRDIAGIMTHAHGVLIPRKDKILEALTPPQDYPTAHHPFRVEVAEISLDDPTLIQDYLDPDKLVTLKMKTPGVTQYVPLHFPTAKRYLHIDIGLTADALGIAMACRGATLNVERTDNTLGLKTVERAPYIHVDFLLRVKAFRGGEVDLSKVRSFILYLAELGFNLSVSYDSFQSRDSQQIMAKMGFGTIKAGKVTPMTLSVDRDDAPYLALRSAIMENRIHYYRYEPFLQEISQVLYDRDKRKVDHPEKGSKDISDALAGVVFRINEEAPDSAIAHGPLPVETVFGKEGKEEEVAADPSKDVANVTWVLGDYDKGY